MAGDEEDGLVALSPDEAAAVLKLAPEIELRLIKANVCGGEAAFFMEIRPMLGDQAMTMTAIDVMTFDDDAKITTLRAYFDMAEMRPADD